MPEPTKEGNVMTLYDINAYQSKEIDADIRKILVLEQQLSRTENKDSKKRLEADIQRVVDKLAAQSPATARYVLKSLGSTHESDIPTAWRKSAIPRVIPVDHWEKLGLVVPSLNLNDFTPGTWAIQFPFVLRKPYISRDDTEYYVVDNPIKKEWISKLPYIAPSQWKGALRSAMMLAIGRNLVRFANEQSFTTRRVQLYRLFGNEKEDAALYLNTQLATLRVKEKPSRCLVI